jgi:hypothetical protein
MDPTKSFVLIGPTNSFGYTYVPFERGMELSEKQMAKFQKKRMELSEKQMAMFQKMSQRSPTIQPFGRQPLFVKQHKVPSHIQCLMCNMEILARDSKFYAIFDRQFDDFEAYIHEECTDQYSKLHKKDIKRDLTAIHLKERLQRSEKYTNLVHLINLGTERRLDLHLVDFEPKFSSVVPQDISPSQSYKPGYYTYDSYVEYLHNELSAGEGLGRRQKKKLKKEIQKAETYAQHYHPIREAEGIIPSMKLNVLPIDVPSFCSFCNQPFSPMDEVLMLYLPQKQRIESFLHSLCKTRDTQKRVIHKWNRHSNKSDSFKFKVSKKKPKGIKKFKDVVFLEPGQELRDLMFGNIEVPGKSVVMVEDNTCVCDLDCNCNCNCNCGS